MPTTDGGGAPLEEGLDEADLRLDDEAAEGAPAAPSAATPPAGAAPGSSAAPAVLGVRAGTTPHPPPEASAAAEGGIIHPPTLREFGEGWELYRAPVLTAVFAGVALGLVGLFVVLRRAVFVSATISQAAGLGVALAFYLGIHHGLTVSPEAAALGLALLAAATLALPYERLRLPRDTVLGVAYLVASAGAVLLGDRIAQEAHDVAAILFGTAVLVRDEDLLLVALTSGVVVAAVLALRRGWVLSGFDPEGARVQGLPVRALELGLWALVATEVAVTTRALGALPVFALAVLPGVTALAVARTVGGALVLAAALGAFSGGVGYLAAFLGELPVGACQAAVAAVPFVVALGLARLRGPG